MTEPTRIEELIAMAQSGSGWAHALGYTGWEEIGFIALNAMDMLGFSPTENDLNPYLRYHYMAWSGVKVGFFRKVTLDVAVFYAFNGDVAVMVHGGTQEIAEKWAGKIRNRIADEVREDPKLVRERIAQRIILCVSWQLALIDEEEERELIDYDETPQGELPGKITFNTELEREAQRADLLMTVMEMVLKRQKIIGEDEKPIKGKWMPWATRAKLTLADGRTVEGEIYEQREHVSPEDGEPYWTDDHGPFGYDTDHDAIEYKASIWFAA